MWSAFARAVLAALLLAGCEHQLALSLSLSSDSCNTPVPAGGSIQYLINGTTSFCGGCLAVDQPLTDAEQITAFLRAKAPVCGGVKPSSSLVVKVTAYEAAGCPEPPAARVFCSESQPVPIPDGHDDAVAVVVLSCVPQCMGACQPATCLSLGKDCGMLSDGCGGMLSCGGCTPPKKCGGGGVPNVCAK
jgi:hypothetical protein